MGNFLLLLCVLAALASVGPSALLPWYGLRGIRRRDTDDVEQAAKLLPIFGGGLALTGLLGAVAISFSDTYGFDTPWVIISITLTLVLLAVVYAWTVPALRKGAKLLGGSPDSKVKEVNHPADALDNVAGRVGAAAGVTALLIVLITIMVVTRPFGV
ncbi:MAG: hypothetical protein H0T78_07780 [Longispora sp.]|nr:hypothetical protein [Longispora sp. (in: high G+C Gram-positive bacteria)]